MNNSFNLSFNHFVRLFLFFSIIPAISLSFFPGRIVLITVLLSYPLFLFLLLFVYKYYYFRFELSKIYYFFIIYSILIFIRGVFDLKSSQDISFLFSNGFVLSFVLPLCIYLASSEKVILQLVKSFFLLIPIVLFLVDYNQSPYGVVKTLGPIYFFIILIPYLSKRKSIIVLVLSIFLFFIDITIRANMLLILISYLIMLTYYFQGKFTFKLLSIVRLSLIFFPILFLILGYLGIFNIFLVGDYFDNFVLADSSGRTQNVLVDSRTGIYQDVFNGLDKNNSYFFGLGGSGKTDTYWTDATWGNFDEIYKEGRRATESGLLNYLQYGGLVGASIYFLLFIRASYLGVFYSNNWLCVMLGVFVMFKGFFSFIGDPLVFNLYSIFHFFTIGLLLNFNFRKKTDPELSYFFKYGLKNISYLKL